jgi:hypothetical protein
MLTVGLKDEFEQNKFALSNKDSLLANSYQFWEWQAYVHNSDTTINRYGLFYKQRTDYAVNKTGALPTLHKSAFAESYGGFLDLLKNANHQLKTTATYRRLKIVDSSLTLQKPDNSLVSRIEYDLRLLKGAITSNTFYEIGSGLELKKEYSFIKVPVGQGVYVHIDYNDNGVIELNEFEIAVLPGTADYIKVFTPTNDYIKSYSNQFSQTIMLKPAALWANKTGVKKIIARFSNQATYRVDRKSTEEDLLKAYNPFLVQTNNNTLQTLNSLFRNTLYVNQLSPVFGVDLTYQAVRNKLLLVNGFDSRQNIFKEARLRWNMSQQFSWNIIYKDGQKVNNSDFFSTRNYSIIYYEAEPKFNYQPNTAFRTSVSFKYTDKKNNKELGGQQSILQDYGVEIKYNVLNKGSLNAKFNFIKIQYTDSNNNSSIAFEMLDALQPGKNMTWGLTYQRTLSNNLQLSITYDGRSSEKTKIIHTGGAQVRAYF